LVALGILSCSSNSIQDEVFEEDLALVFAHAEAEELIKIPSITNFSWDKFFVFTPYTPVDKIENDLGFRDKRLEKTDISLRDDFNLLVFVKDNKVVHYVEFYRQIGNFERIASQKGGLTPKEAVFKVDFQDEHGSPILIWEARSKE
jgi:hypothetical protein